MIGVFDSGIGGLSVLRALRAELPHEDFLYVADSGHAPYGERGDAHVLARSRAIAAHLVGQGIQALVIACNTATAAAIDVLRADYPALPIVGVEPALKPAATVSKTGRIGVMATRNTLCSGRFQSLLAAQAGRAAFVLQACDGLADAIERSASTMDATKTIASCTRHISAMGAFGTEKGQIDTLVLGCTHYPFASEILCALAGPDVRLIDNGAAVARQTRRRLPQVPGGMAPARAGQVTLQGTGEAAPLQAAARRWLHLPGDNDGAVELLRV